MGWITLAGTVAFNPILTQQQRLRVARFLVGYKSAYHRDYYQRVTKPKREAARLARLSSKP